MLTKEQLKKLIKEELERNETREDWGGNGHEIKRDQWGLDAGMREEVNGEGKNHGCHTCPSKIAVDRNQPWIGDHIPPTELNPLKCVGLMQKGWDGKRYLFPQCQQCSAKQSALVRALKNWAKQVASLDAQEMRLLGHLARFKVGINCVESSGPSLTATEGDAIQKLGLKNGCHSCEAKVPALTYHADHTFPQEFCTDYMEKLFAHLGIPYPDNFELKPQCPRCSGHQGGKMKQIRDEAIEYCRNVLNLAVYKF